MEEPRTRYILVQDRVGYMLERSMLSLGLSTKSTPTQLLKGELLEALPETEQPNDSTRVALAGIDRKSLRLECPMEDLARLTNEDANLLLAISSVGLRYQTYIDRKRLDFGRRILPGSQVLVEVKGIAKKLHGTVWHVGDLPPNPGTMFGVELIKNSGLGTSDGTFRNKRYFTCPPDSGVFVGLDKLSPLEDSDLKSPSKPPKRDENAQANFASRLMPSFLKGKNDQKALSERTDYALKIDQRVVAFVEDVPFKGVVRYIGDEKDSSGHVRTIVGLELDKRCGSGTGKRNGKQLFVAKREFAAFVDIKTVMPEKDFDENPGEDAKRKTSKNEDYVSKQFRKDEALARSMSYNDHSRPSGEESVKKVRRTSSVDSADQDVIMAAGESSQTDHTAFIEQQRQMLNDMESSKLSTKKDRDVMMHGDERTDSATNLNFDDNHFRQTSADTFVKNNSPITKQPGLSNVSTSMYHDFVNIEKIDYEEMMQQHESKHDPMVAEVVPDKAEDGILSKEPTEQLGSQNDADKTTDLEVQIAVGTRHGLELGSMVEVPLPQGPPRYGVIRWIGLLPSLKDKLVAGLELEDEQSACSDGTFSGKRYFTCPPGRGFFILLENCRQDSRFTPNSPISDSSLNSRKAFGSLPSPDVSGISMPPTSLKDTHCGTMRGLQGHHNSCYLDATLYSMFAFSSVFDTLLHRERKDADLPEYDEVQLVLRESIVNPLRVHGFVRADRILQLREQLDKLSSTAGLVNEEKDPEEFLNSLLRQVLKADPFLHLKSRDVREHDSEGAFFYQIITEKDETVKVAQVQRLLEQSFLSADIILSEVPSCLILQMPRFGNRYKMYDLILPNLELEVTHIVENFPRECTMCGNEVAMYECKMCYQKGVFLDGPGIASYCQECNSKVHGHRERVGHKPRPVLLPRQYNSERRRLDKQTMELFAVVCIETSHYVAFVKCGIGVDAPWCFFDSMADRKGEKNGYNIPAVTPCPEAKEWLSKDVKEIESAKEKGEIPGKVRRLLGDGYLCMYQNLDMTMYK